MAADDSGVTMPLFAGRTAELAWLRRMLLVEARDRGVVVLGPPGRGKTALLRQFLDHSGHEFSGGARFTAARPMSLQRHWPISLQGGGQKLMVIDEADSVPEDELAAYLRTHAFLPGTRVLMSSRRELPRIPGFAQLYLSPLTAEEIEALGALLDLPPHTRQLIHLTEGEPLAMQLLARFAREPDLREVIERLGVAPVATILDPDGRPIGSTDAALRRIELTAEGVGDRLINALAKRPELMYEISPRRFEELVAELYAREGYEVELTPVARDGGVDVYAVQRTPFGSFLTVIDCKRYRKDRPVGVALVRQLLGTVEATDASVGVLATTSTFTKPAQDFREERRFRLGLQDFLSIHELLLRQADART